MFRFGILCPPAVGHLNPMCALTDELKRRGSEVIFFSVPDSAPLLDSLGVEYAVFGESEFPPGSAKAILAEQGKLRGIAGLRFTITTLSKSALAVLRDLPGIVAQSGIQGLLIDQVSGGSGSTLSDICRVPFVTICNALPVNLEDSVPPFFTGWAYAEGRFARLRNRIGNGLFETFLRGPAYKAVQAHRRRLGLPPLGGWDGTQSKLAIIGQLPAEFDFPRRELPSWFHYVGPLQNPSRNESVSRTALHFHSRGSPATQSSMLRSARSRTSCPMCFAGSRQAVSAWTSNS